MKTTDYNEPTIKNRADAYWRFKHGFDNIDPAPDGWLVMGVDE